MSAALITSVIQARDEAISASSTDSNHDYTELADALDALVVALSIPGNANALSNTNIPDKPGNADDLDTLANALSTLADMLDGMTDAHVVDKLPSVNVPGPLADALGEILDTFLEQLGGVDAINAIS